MRLLFLSLSPCEGSGCDYGLLLITDICDAKCVMKNGVELVDNDGAITLAIIQHSHHEEHFSILFPWGTNNSFSLNGFQAVYTSLCLVNYHWYIRIIIIHDINENSYFLENPLELSISLSYMKNLKLQLVGKV